jgi:hypothetical protein
MVTFLMKVSFSNIGLTVGKGKWRLKLGYLQFTEYTPTARGRSDGIQTWIYWEINQKASKRVFGLP